MYLVAAIINNDRTRVSELSTCSNVNERKRLESSCSCSWSCCSTLKCTIVVVISHDNPIIYFPRRDEIITASKRRVSHVVLVGVVVDVLPACLIRCYSHIMLTRIAQMPFIHLHHEPPPGFVRAKGMRDEEKKKKTGWHKSVSLNFPPLLLWDAHHLADITTYDSHHYHHHVGLSSEEIFCVRTRCTVLLFKVFNINNIGIFSMLIFGALSLFRWTPRWCRLSRLL